ncbi:MAG: hypothetical protein AMXMBFR13_29770 [Phycisphaerae bacterium]
MPTASIKLTSDFVAVSMQRERRYRVGFRRFALKLGLFVLLVPLIATAFWVSHAITGILLLVLSLAMFFAQYLDYWLARRSFRKSSWRDEIVTIEFTEADIRYHSPRVDTVVQWSLLTQVVHFSDGFLLYQDAKPFSWIPASSLSSPSEVAELNRLLRSKIAKHVFVDRKSAGHCQSCGYDLTGNTSGVCPECGTQLTSTAGLDAEFNQR